MNKPWRAGPITEQPAGAERRNAAYRPAVDAYALKLIARIKRDHRDTEAVLALQAHYERHGDLPSLANLLEGWASTLRDDRKAADAYVKAADAVRSGLFDRERAKALCARALARYPEHPVALDLFEALATELGEDRELEHMLQHLAGELARRNAGAAQRAQLHYRLGQHYEHRLGLAGRAIAQYRAALEVDRQYLPAIIAARNIYLATSKATAAADMYELEIAATTDPRTQHALLLALARHQRDVLHDFDSAVLAMRRALKALPADTGTIELLADMLRERADRTAGETALADRERAAELYYQVARSVPRAQARPRLIACLALAPAHRRAQVMLDELDGYGGGQPDTALGGRSQAELDALPTGRYPGARPPWTADAAGAVRPAPVPEAEDDAEITAWLEDDAVTLIDEGAHPSSMVPVTDRPPPPDEGSDPRSITDTLRELKG